MGKVRTITPTDAQRAALSRRGYTWVAGWVDHADAKTVRDLFIKSEDAVETLLQAKPWKRTAGPRIMGRR